LSLLAGCTTLSRQNAVPPSLHGQEIIEGMPGIRYQFYSQKGIDAMMRDVKNASQEQGYVGDPKRKDTAYYLSLSGGGDNGAFGAGLLTGWTEHGDRPDFDLVTGVSTGALIAPFAFLGPEYDRVLKQVYTQTTPKDIYIELGLMGALFGDAYADTSPLFRLISKYVDDDLMGRIAYEHEVRNRWLLIATTNLDSGVPILWNMGKLASYRTPEALNLFRKIMLASAAIPGAFPPVMIDVMAQGKHYQEMHVDGGATTQVFMYPAALGAEARRTGVVSQYKKRQEFIIRNARLDSEWQQIERNTLDIMSRGINQLIQSQSFGDIQRIYLTSMRDKVDFNLAYIGPDFNVPHVQEFDRPYMDALYAYGHHLGAAGYPWARVPPGFDEPLNVDVNKQVKRQQSALGRSLPVQPTSQRQLGKLPAPASISN
jgi:predicted acylesterase/phospholipase RssA